jgi:hypothetical protein
VNSSGSAAETWLAIAAVTGSKGRRCNPNYT